MKNSEKAKMQNLSEIESYELIHFSQVEDARKMGLRIHHEFVVETRYFFDHDNEMVYDEDYIVSDDWYAATEEFVQNYHNNGGCWSYCD